MKNADCPYSGFNFVPTHHLRKWKQRDSQTKLAIFTAVVVGMIFNGNAQAQEPISLLSTVAKWQFPRSELGRAEASDGATANASGDRTLPSTIHKATMSTNTSVQKVVEHYKAILADAASKDHPLAEVLNDGVSVSISDESVPDVVELHTVCVNTHTSSTVIAVTRAKGMDTTLITWKQYIRHPVRTE